MNELINGNLLAIIVGLSLALLGIVIQKTRAYFLIAGYNTSTSEERSKVNIKAVAKSLRNTLILLGIVWVAIPVISDLLKLGEIKWLIVIVLHIAITLELVFRVNSKEKYKRTTNANTR